MDCSNGPGMPFSRWTVRKGIEQARHHFFSFTAVVVAPPCENFSGTGDAGAEPIASFFLESVYSIYSWMSRSRESISLSMTFLWPCSGSAFCGLAPIPNIFFKESNAISLP